MCHTHKSQAMTWTILRKGILACGRFQGGGHYSEDCESDATSELVALVRCFSLHAVAAVQAPARN